MPISIANPLFLLVWLLIPTVWFFLFRARTARLPIKTVILPGVLRTLLFVLIGLSLSQPSWLRNSDRVNLFFCLDVSDSVRSDERVRAEAFIKQSGRAMGEEDRAGLIVFGQQPSLEVALAQGFEFDSIRSSVNTPFTDIAKALELAVARLPQAGTNRIVLLSDGNENLGNAREMAYLARSLGIQVHPVPLRSWYRGNEVFMRDLHTPSSVPVQTPFEIRLLIMSTTQGPADLVLFRNDKILAHESLELKPGKNVHRFVDLLESPGLYLYKAVVNAQKDAVFENNTALSFTQGSKKSYVLYVHDGNGSGDHLIRALRVQGLEIIEARPDGIPQTIQGYVDYGAVILDNVPADVFSHATMELLEKYVKDIGGGLLMIGGDRSFGAGGYLNTSVERALPVYMEAPTKVEFPGLCIIFVLDKSSSMSGNLRGANKLEGAKSAAFSAVQLLNPLDRVGILAFDSSFRWVVPITQAKYRKKIAEELSRLEEGGGTDLYLGLKEAFRALEEISAAKKHIIALSDGLTVKADFRSLVRAMREKRITISTVAVGSDADRKLLGDIAKWGGGRSYYTDDAKKIPRIFVGETKVASKKLIVEKDLQPRAVETHEMTDGLDQGGFPPVRGLVVTYPKPGAQRLLDTAEGPLLVAWQYGLGRSLAFTSDLGGRWGGRWVEWSHYEKFCSQMVKWAVKKETRRKFSAAIEARGEMGTFTVDVTDRMRRFVNRLDLQLQVLRPSKQSQTISLEQIAPGRYRGRFSVPQRGEYYLTLFGWDGQGPLETQTFGFAIPYTAEYEKMHVNRALLNDLADITGGTTLSLEDDPGKLFQSPSGAKEAGVRLWPYLAMAALLVLILDVAARKVIRIRSSTI